MFFGAAVKSGRGEEGDDGKAESCLTGGIVIGVTLGVIVVIGQPEDNTPMLRDAGCSKASTLNTTILDLCHKDFASKVLLYTALSFFLTTPDIFFV